MLLRKAVIIAAPHTSWHDFYIGVLLRKVLGIKTNFIGKKELFIGPLGWYLRAIGGAPIDRQAKENKVQAIARLFEDREEFFCNSTVTVIPCFLLESIKINTRIFLL